VGEPLTDQEAVEAALLRPLTATEAGYVTADGTGLIAQASAQLRNRLRAIDTRIAAYEADPTDPTGIDPDAVTSMLANVIKRVLLNPQGAASTSNTAGPFAKSTTFRSVNTIDLGLQVTDDDLALILPPDAVDGYVPAGTIRTRPRHLLGPTGPRW
jgi:hypothetical protein